MPDDEQHAPSADDPKDVDDLRSLDTLARMGHSPGMLLISKVPTWQNLAREFLLSKF